jgi:L-rhamnose-H+ transport protein
MIQAGILLALLSGICNGLFTAPMKLARVWKWENIWFVFIGASCLVLPAGVVGLTVPNVATLYDLAPRAAVACALGFGFAWGFGAILFGRSVDRLGVSLANTLVIGISSALGSLVPLALAGGFLLEARQAVLFLGVAAFLAGVWTCGAAGRRRESGGTSARPSWLGYAWAAGSGIMSAVFNIGYTLALPIADTGVKLGYSRFFATNCIWLLMLGAGSIPNLVYCGALGVRHSSLRLFVSQGPLSGWALSTGMALLWGGSIFLYGAATPLLGDIGPSIGWPLSLATGLLVANLMGFLLGEWRAAPREAVRRMRWGIAILLGAIVLCALSTQVGTS